MAASEICLTVSSSQFINVPGVSVNRDGGSKGKGWLGSSSRQSHARIACCECMCGTEDEREDTSTVSLRSFVFHLF